MEIKQTTHAGSILDDLLKNSEESNNKRIRNLHVSDILYPRLAYFNRFHYKPPTEKDLLCWTAGTAHHNLLENLYKKKEAKEKSIEWEGIHGTCDMVEASGEPIEIKTTRAYEVYRKDNIPEGYINQLKYYMAMIGSLRGHLFIFYLAIRENGAMTPKLVSYEVRITKEEIEEIKRDIINRKNSISEAMISGDIKHLPKCQSFMCKNCKYLELCTKGEE
jgi:CRISPR/Cas system-associated exonuclease Cas4 (RecB family)